MISTLNLDIDVNVKVILETRVMARREEVAMRIGEVARRTGVAPRLIRYYEGQGLLQADREPNGYRTYADRHVERVERIAGLVQSGIPTRLIRVLLDVEEACVREEPTCSDEVAELLARQLAALEERIECLSASRDTVRTFLERTRGGEIWSAPAAP